MTQSVVFDPLIVWASLGALAVAFLLFVLLAAWRGLSGWWLRLVAAGFVLLALANPSLQREDREALEDILVAVIDRTASQGLADRMDQAERGIAQLEEEVARLPNTRLQVIDLGDGPDNSGTRLMTTIADALGEVPAGRLAGVFLLTDGQLHDAEVAVKVPAPLHALMTGRKQDWDRRIVVTNAPAFAIINETLQLTVRVEDQGNAPATAQVPLSISVNGGAPTVFTVPVGQNMRLPVNLPSAGNNVLQFEVPVSAGELTDRNNAAVVQINGIRDRLRVLLVSGEPHAGERTWRNLLKSDAAVDLVHFTILRPPEKQDGVPVTELSLIAFPTRELFLEKIDDFDLIIFDRYRRRGILPTPYLENVVTYVQRGGAVLVSSGPEYGAGDSIYRSPLGEILPGAPTARVFERGFTPQITALGRKHPVTEGLDGQISENVDATPPWGRWLRQVEIAASPSAMTVMSGLDALPLLLLDRVGAGRVALIASDHSWLWDRGFEGGGPQQELLRRLAHWMMGEPELEEEALWVEPSGLQMRIIRRTLSDGVGDVTITHPDGTQSVIGLDQTSAGRYETIWQAPEIGLYRLTDGVRSTVIAVGPPAPIEFEDTVASTELLAPVLAATGGGAHPLEDGGFSLRQVRQGRPAAGRGWLGVTPREAYRTSAVTTSALLPAWLYLLMAAGVLVIGWLREGRR